MRRASDRLAPVAPFPPQPRVELLRFFFECPELKVTLTAAAAAYLRDDEMLRTWRYDEAWEAYKATLSEAAAHATRCPRMGGGASAARPSSWEGVGALPAFRAPLSALPPPSAQKEGLKPDSLLYAWLGDFLEERVVKVMREGVPESKPMPRLVDFEPAAVTRVPAPAASPLVPNAPVNSVPARPRVANQRAPAAVSLAEARSVLSSWGK